MEIFSAFEPINLFKQLQESYSAYSLLFVAYFLWHSGDMFTTHKSVFPPTPSSAEESPKPETRVQRPQKLIQHVKEDDHDLVR